MITVSEMKNRILAYMEEAGCERLNPLINTVLDPTGAPEEVEIFQQALEELVRSNLILIFMTSMDAPRDLLDRSGELQALAALPAYYKYLPDKRWWHDIRCSGPPYFVKPEPEAELTDAGMERAIELLEEHGVEWWHPGRYTSSNAGQ